MQIQVSAVHNSHLNHTELLLTHFFSFFLHRYGCDSCDTAWQQVPPHRIDSTDDINEVTICKRNTKRSSDYKCGKCGKLKKGHVCIAASTSTINSTSKKNIVDSLVQNVYHPPAVALQQGETISVPFADYSELELLPSFSSVFEEQPQ